jgi:hypothetical protein
LSECSASVSRAASQEAVRRGALASSLASCTLSGAASREAVRCGALAGRPARRAGCPAVLGVEAPPSNSLRAPRALRSDSDGESVDDARCARGPRPLRSSATLRRAATHHLPPRGASRLAQTRRFHVLDRSRNRILALGQAPVLAPVLARAMELVKALVLGPTPTPSRQRGPGGGAFGGGEKRSDRVGARSALREHTRRRCLSAALFEREASSTAQPGREHRSRVGLTADRTRRPHPQAPATARRSPTMPRAPHVTYTSGTQGKKTRPSHKG